MSCLAAGQPGPIILIVMLNNNPKIDQLTTLSKEQLIHLVNQERSGSQALLAEYEKMRQMALKYSIMSDLLSLHLYRDPAVLKDRIGSLSVVYASWGDALDVEPC